MSAIEIIGNHLIGRIRMVPPKGIFSPATERLFVSCANPTIRFLCVFSWKECGTHITVYLLSICGFAISADGSGPGRLICLPVKGSTAPPLNSSGLRKLPYAQGRHATPKQSNPVSASRSLPVNFCGDDEQELKFVILLEQHHS